LISNHLLLALTQPPVSQDLYWQPTSVSWWLSRRLTAESWCAIVDFEGLLGSTDGLIPTRFRRIQVCPKDSPATLGEDRRRKLI